MKNRSTHIMRLFMALLSLGIPAAVCAMEQREPSDQELRRQIIAVMSTVDLDRRDEHGKTPLHLLVNSEHSGIFARLALAFGADPDAQDHYGNTPLHGAAYYGHEEMATALLDEDANIDAENNLGETPLHRAVQSGSEAMVSLLLARGANADIKPVHG